jgi:hypothetical protein
VVLKIFPKAAYGHCRKFTNSRETKMEIDQWQRRKAETEISLRLAEQYLEFVFRKCKKHFTYKRQPKIVLKPFAHVQKVMI